MGRVIAASTMNSNRQNITRGPVDKSDYDGDEVLSPTSSHSSNLQETPKNQSNSQLDKSGGMPVSKKYCCSNSAQYEAKVWGIFDVVTASLVLIIQVYFTLTLKLDRQLLQAIVNSNKDNERDLNRFLEYSSLKQDLILTVVITREIVSVLLGILLYTSAKLKVHHQLRIWLGSTFIAIVLDLFLFIPKMAFTQNKFLYVSGMIVYFLYKWYEVWIVTILFKEIRQEIAESKLVGDVRTQESERDMDKPPDIGTISSQMARNIGTMNLGKTFPASSNIGGYGGSTTGNVHGTPIANIRSFGHGIGRDSAFGYGGGDFIRNYDTVRSGHVGWEPDPMGSTSTFVLSQPPKRLKFQTQPIDMTMVEAKSPTPAEYYGSSRY